MGNRYTHTSVVPISGSRRIDPHALLDVIKGLGVKRAAIGTNADGDLVIQTVAPLDQGTLVAAVSTHRGQHDARRLARARGSRFEDVGRRTKRILSAGFEYPPSSGARFDVRESIETIDASVGVFPVILDAIGDGSDLELGDASEVGAYLAAARSWDRGVRVGGSQVKRGLRSASSLGELRAVKDTRE